MMDYIKFLKDAGTFFVLVHIIVLLTFPTIAGEWAAQFAKAFFEGTMR